MILEMKVPSPGESISEVEIAQWLVADGDYVEKDQTIAEVDSDKATLDLPAEESGVITLKASEGDVVPVGNIVCHIDTSVKKSAKKHIEPTIPVKDDKIIEPQSNPEKIISEKAKNSSPSPAASKILSEKGINPLDVIGSGRGGRITKEDALKALPKIDESLISKGRKTERKKLSMLRRKLSQRLVAVKNLTAMLTTFNEVDMSPIMTIRKRYQDEFQRSHNGTRLGFMSFFVRAATEALKRFPAVNASIDGEDIIYHGYYDIGVAVSTDRGLVVPVLRDTDALGLAQIESEIISYGEKARENKLSLEDLSGGTFTITNGGIFGSLMSTPILNAPQTGVLGMHNIVERPVVVEGEIVVRPMMYLALSYDHRLIDGKDAVQFLVAIKGMIEDPARILLEL